MQRPQRDRREPSEVVGQALVADRHGECRHAFEAMLARGGTEKRQRVFRIAREPEQGAHERTVIAEDLELAPKRDAEAGGKRFLRARFGGDAASVFAGNAVVIREHDGVLAGEVVVRGAERHAGGGGDVSHGGRIEATLGGRGRVLIRPSGTEPLVRVMVEAPTEREAAEFAQELAEVVTTLAAE